MCGKHNKKHTHTQRLRLPDSCSKMVARQLLLVFVQFYYLFYVFFVVCTLRWQLKEIWAYFCCCFAPRTNCSLSLSLSPSPSYTQQASLRSDAKVVHTQTRTAAAAAPIAKHTIRAQQQTNIVGQSLQVSLPLRLSCFLLTRVPFLPLSCRFPLASCNHYSSPLPDLASLLSRSNRVSRVNTRNMPNLAPCTRLTSCNPIQLACCSISL